MSNFIEIQQFFLNKLRTPIDLKTADYPRKTRKTRKTPINQHVVSNQLFPCSPFMPAALTAIKQD